MKLVCIHFVQPSIYYLIEIYGVWQGKVGVVDTLALRKRIPSFNTLYKAISTQHTIY